jgi:hypothetical protein
MIDNIVPFEDSNKGFNTMVTSIVDNFLHSHKAITEQKGIQIAGVFFVLAIYNHTNTISYWGLLDMETMPDEDIYTETRRRFLAANMILGASTIQGYGILDLAQVISRQVTPLSKPPKS